MLIFYQDMELLLKFYLKYFHHYIQLDLLRNQMI